MSSNPSASLHHHEPPKDRSGAHFIAAVGNGNAASLSKVASLLVLGVFQNIAVEFPKKNQIERWKKTATSPLQKQLLKKRKPPAPPPPKNVLVRVYQLWYRLPQIFRFFVGGNLGNICFFYTERALFDFLSTNPYNMFSLEFLDSYLAGLSFFSAYLLQIFTTHLFFAFLVYGLDSINSVEKYSKTLWGQFRVYAFSLVGSTALNSYLIKEGVDKTLAFFGTMAAFACINYFLVSWIVKRSVISASKERIDASLQEVPGRRTPYIIEKKIERNPGQIAKAWAIDKIRRGGAFGGSLPPLAFTRGKLASSGNGGRSDAMTIQEHVIETGVCVSIDSINAL